MKATDWPPARLPAHVGPSVRPSVSFLVHDSAFRTNLVAPIQSVPLGQHTHIVTATEASERASKRRRIYALTIRHCVPRHYQPLPYLFPPRSEAKRSEATSVENREIAAHPRVKAARNDQERRSDEIFWPVET